MTRWAAGISYAWQKFSFRSEYVGGHWDNSIGGTKCAEPFAYYAKLAYRFADWGKAMLHYDVADLNFKGYFFTQAGGEEKYTTITPSVQLYASESTAIQIQYDICDWKLKDDSDKLKFNRFTVGTRITF